MPARRRAGAVWARPYLIAAALILVTAFARAEPAAATASPGRSALESRAGALTPSLPPSDLDFTRLLPHTVSTSAIYRDPGHFVWDPALIRTDDGTYHLLYSRWAMSLGYDAWATHAEIAWATATRPEGPYTFQRVVLPHRGIAYWDGHSVFNTAILRHGSKFYLYYTGNRGTDAWRPDRPTGGMSDDEWWGHRNNQRIGVAVAEHPGGPWTRFDKPLVDVGPNTGQTIVNVPNPLVRPDGRVMLFYKTLKAGPGRFGGGVVHYPAVGDGPLGPFTRYPRQMVDKQAILRTDHHFDFHIDDHVEWYQGDRYYAIVKDHDAPFMTPHGRSLLLFESPDGFEWRPSRHSLAQGFEIAWSDGTSQKFERLEMPKLLFEGGQPRTLALAALPEHGRESYIVLLPIAPLPAALVNQTADAVREVRDLSGAGWKAWRDEQAVWKGDELHAPGEFTLSQLPVHPPTGGWATLERTGVPAHVPASVEELFADGDSGFTYHGVSWFWRDVDVPAGWSGRQVRLKIGKARLRVEVYVNGTLAGYDLCAETPLDFDVSGPLAYGQRNRLAVRLTNPGGTRGWDDYVQIPWGPYMLPASHDFSGLDDVTLVATDSVYVADVFVKNVGPATARRVDLEVTVENATDAIAQRDVRVTVRGSGASALVEGATLQPGRTVVTVPVEVPDAALWDVDHPSLYTCDVALVERGHTADSDARRFGFRTFELRQAGGRHEFFLNDVRFRHRSAIDWGYYARNGFYATDDAALKSVRAAKAIGHNGINQHRRIAEPRQLDRADEVGIVVLEEPGGFHDSAKDGAITPTADSLAGKLLVEKVRRMVLRDRNHPSVLIYNLSNENNVVAHAVKNANPAPLSDGEWARYGMRRAGLDLAHRLDPTRLVINSSGGDGGGPSGPIPHYRPYEDVLRWDYQDDHTVDSKARFPDEELKGHGATAADHAFYYGEVRCYTGPDNWVRLAEGAKTEHARGHDLQSFAGNAAKLTKAFGDWHLADVGSRRIASAADISTQAARSLMYTDGRLGQRVLANDGANGYAINGWSCGSHVYEGHMRDWDSALLDSDRNLKGPAEDLAYWVRPAQVAIVRTNGKYFTPGQTATFAMTLINEARLAAGTFTLRLRVTDGAGVDTGFEQTTDVAVAGGHTYAQALGGIDVTMARGWRAGYVTLRATLVDAGGRVVADGSEQVLLANRASYGAALAGTPAAVEEWPAAAEALQQAGIPPAPIASARVVLAGGAAANHTDVVDALLARARAGATVIVRFDEGWARRLHEAGILSAPVTEWGGVQTGYWNGNGWGYLDHFVGDQAVPSGATIGTRGWEVPGDPTGFYPFESAYRLSAYGLYVARPEHLFPKAWPSADSPPPAKPAMPTLLVLLGTVDVGKGKLLLAPSYPVDEGQAFNDLLFFEMVRKAARGEW